MPHQMSFQEIHFKRLLLFFFRKNDLFLTVSIRQEISPQRTSTTKMCVYHENMGRKKKKQEPERKALAEAVYKMNKKGNAAFCNVASTNP